MNAPASHLRARLKSSTSARHAALDAHPAMAGLTEPGFPLPRYRALLQAHHAFLSWVEPPLEEALERLGLPFPYGHRRKLPLVERDLRWFGLVPEGALPPPSASPPTTLPALAGVLYVLEGSTLGGQLIARALERHLALGPTTGAAYFQGYGAETRARWVEVLAFLDQAASDEAQLLEAERYAHLTFELFGQALERVQLSPSPA